MQIRIVFLLISAFAFTTAGQSTVPPQPARDLEPLAVASIHVEKRTFKSGQEIRLTVLLEAGPQGAYIPKEWGEMGGGIPGFAVNLVTTSHRTAETCGVNGDAVPKHEPDAKVVLNRDYMYLPAQHIIGLRTVIICPTKQPGKYFIEAYYSPFNIDADAVAQLPETRGLVLREGLHAKPVLISIY